MRNFTLIFLFLVALCLSIFAPARAQKAELVVQLGHTEGISSVTYSPDGKTLASGSNDNTVKLWNVATGQLLRTLQGHTDWIRSITYSPDGKTLASASRDDTLKLWDVRTGRLLRTLQAQTSTVNSVVYSPDGKTLASANEDKTVKIWDVTTGEVLRTLQGHTDPVWSVAYSPDGQTLASGSVDTTMKIWDVVTGRLLRTMQGQTGIVDSVTYSPDGKTLASGGWSKTARLWDVETGKLLRTLKGHTDRINSVSYSPDGKILACGSWDKTVKLWDVETGKLLRTLKGHTDIINSATCSPDGQTLASASDDNTVKFWDIATGKLLRTLQSHTKGINNSSIVTYSPDGKTLASASQDDTVKLWNAATGQRLRTLKSHTSTVNNIVYSPDSKTLASASLDNTVKLWDVVTGQLLQTLPGHEYGIKSVSYSPDSKTLTSKIGDSTIKLWNVGTGQLLRTLQGHKYGVSSATYSPDGKTLASVGDDETLALAAGDDKTVKLWNAATGKLLRTLQGHTGTVNNIIYSPDGKTLASASDDKTVNLWNVATGQRLRTLQGHTGSIIRVTYAPDGKTLASASYDKTVKLWNVATGKLLQTFKADSNVTYSPDGKTLASGSGDNTIKLWDVATGQSLRTLQGHTGTVRNVTYSPDGKTLTSESMNQLPFGIWENTVELWSVATGQVLQTFEANSNVTYSPDGKTLASGSWNAPIRFWNLSSATPTSLTPYIFDNGDSVFLDDQGRFDGTPGGLEQLHYVVGMEPVALEQLKERYYTPGLWEKTLGNDKDALPAVPKFNEVALYPDIEIIPPAPGDTKLRVRLKNQGGGLGRVMVKVGGKELTADARGKGFDDTATAQTLEVELRGAGAAGQTVPVEVVAWNAQGDVRSRGVRMEYQPPGEREVVKPHFYAIVVGASRFPNNSQLDLQFASKDAADMAKALQLGAQGLFESAQIHLLSSDGASPADKPTRENIARVFADVAKEAREGDVLVVYFSGHGVGLRVEGRDYYCYLTQDARDVSDAAFADPQVRATVAITSEDLANWTNPKTGIKAQKQVLILDTCAAGAVAARLDQQKDTDADVVRAVDRLNERSGFYVLMGCAASAQSFEANRFGQGILTYSLLQGVKGAALRDGRFVDVAQLFTFAQDGAENLAKSVGLSQQPRTMTGNGQTFDIGELDEAKKGQIPLARAKPVLLRPTLQNETEGFDNLELAAPVQSALREACLSAARGDGAPIFLAVEPGEFAEGVKPTISYRVEGDTVKARVIFSQKGKKLGETNVEGPATPEKRGELVEKLVAAMLAAQNG